MNPDDVSRSLATTPTTPSSPQLDNIRGLELGGQEPITQRPGIQNLSSLGCGCFTCLRGGQLEVYLFGFGLFVFFFLAGLVSFPFNTFSSDCGTFLLGQPTIRRTNPLVTEIHVE